MNVSLNYDGQPSSRSVELVFPQSQFIQFWWDAAHDPLNSYVSSSLMLGRVTTLLYTQLLQNAPDRNSLFLPSPPQTPITLSFVIFIWLGCSAYRWVQLSCTPKPILELFYVCQSHKCNYFSPAELPAQHCNCSFSNKQCSIVKTHQ